MKATEFIERAGGVVKLAALLGLDHSSVSKWGARQRIPAERVPQLEAKTGIPRHEIRPDLWPAPKRGRK